MEIDVRDMSDPKNKTEKMRIPLLLPHEVLNYLKEPYMQCSQIFYSTKLFILLSIFLGPHLIEFLSMDLDKEKDKIKVTETEKSKFWAHFKSFIGPHQAIDEHEQNPNNSWHEPVGVSGDDARYTLAGRKIIIMMISSVLQDVKNVLPFSYICS